MNIDQKFNQRHMHCRCCNNISDLGYKMDNKFDKTIKNNCKPDEFVRADHNLLLPSFMGYEVLNG